MNGKFQIAMHILTLLSHPETDLLSSEYIAGSINANPALVRKELSNLRNFGMIKSKEGSNGGYALNKPANQILLADIYQAVKQQSILGQAKNMPNPSCPVGRQINEHMNNLYKEIDNTLLMKLGTISLADFRMQFD